MTTSPEEHSDGVETHEPPTPQAPETDPQVPEPESEPAPGRRRRLWTRIGRASVAAPRAMHVLLLVICLFLGTALVTQVRSQRHDPLETLKQEDLVILLGELDEREKVLRAERAELQTRLDQLRRAADQRSAADEAVRKTTELARVNAGTVPVTGQGVQVTVIDKDNALGATQFVMALGELRNAGAEAVELNGVRLTSRAYFSSDARGVLVNGQRISSPYVWKIIGPAKTIAAALEIQAGSAAQMRAKGAQVDILESERIKIDSVATAQPPAWAVPSNN
ncbi:DUF881 domain-containing protein [Schaalia sp. 19OD2882]|nr:DUF881 domain-containing protein [Schaalia sp. 19OD2882]